MDAEAYNKLIFQNKKSSTPIYLVLLCLPKDRSEWVFLNDDELAIRKCCFYLYISGDFTENTDQIRVRIPKINIFNPEKIKQLISEED